jgi:two-component system response regulator
VQDGLEALAFLRREAPYTHACEPDLILLDLNLPGKPGLEVLEEVSTEPILRRIPCVVLTSSHAARDIVRSYELCANCYVVKPTDFEQFQKIVHLLEEFWLTAAELPSCYRYLQ